jgi:hypothetical protein
MRVAVEISPLDALLDSDALEPSEETSSSSSRKHGLSMRCVTSRPAISSAAGGFEGLLGQSETDDGRAVQGREINVVGLDTGMLDLTKLLGREGMHYASIEPCPAKGVTSRPRDSWNGKKLRAKELRTLAVRC